MTVVAPGELDHLGAPGEPAGEPDRRHGRLGPAGHEPDLLQRRDALDHRLGQRDLALGGRAEGRAARDRLLHGGDHLGVRVPEDHRPPGADEVDVLTPVGVGQVRPGAGHHEPGRAADGAEGAHRGVHTAGRDGRGAVEQSLRGRCFVWICQFAHDLRLLRPSRPSPTYRTLHGLWLPRVTSSRVDNRPQRRAVCQTGTHPRSSPGRRGRGCRPSGGHMSHRTFRRATVGRSLTR